MRPIAILAIAILAAFFMPWISVSDPTGRTGVQLSMTGLDIARGSETANTVMDKNHIDKIAGVPIQVWFWALPVLALVTVLTAGKGAVARLMGVVTGAYPLGWIAFGISKIPEKERSNFFQGLGDNFSKFLGVGAYVILLGSVLLLIFGLAGVGTKESD